MSRYIHAEVVDDVLKEYARLHERKPNVSHERKMELAITYVKAIAVADTALLISRLGISL